MKTIRMVFVGGPACGNTRVAPDNIPAIKVPIVPPTVVVIKEGAETRMPNSPRCYCYVATNEQDSNKHRIFRYVGEQ